MILCLCNAITEKQVQELARAGANTPEEAYALLGHEPQCGSCLCYADELIAKEREARPRPNLRIVA